MTDSNRLSKQELELHRTGGMWNGKESVLEIHLRELNRCTASLSEDIHVGEPTIPTIKLAMRAGREKRGEPRFLTNDSASLQILSPFSVEHWQVRVLDVSKNGLGLWTPTATMPGSGVKVMMKDCVAFGTARHCILTIEGFIVGIQLHDLIPCRTASGSLRPETYWKDGE